jgi:mono/diheme cytochrome c family protein
MTWGAAVAVRAAASAPAWQEEAQDPRTPDELAKEVFDLVQVTCIECHGEAKDGGLDLRSEAG